MHTRQQSAASSKPRAAGAQAPEKGVSLSPPTVQLQAASPPIQREEWDLKELHDKGSQKSGKLNSIGKGMMDSLASKVGKEKVGLLGSVHTRLDMVKDALVSRDAEALRKALVALKKQFQSGSPADSYLQQRITELQQNEEATMNTMAAYHNLRKTGNAAPAPEAKNLALLRAHIHKARDAYLSGDYQKAHNLLMDNDVASANGFRIDIINGPKSKKNWVWFNTEKDLISQSMPSLEKAMAWHEKGNEKIMLPLIVPKKTNASENYLDYPELAKMAIPVYLEEWMHKMQKRMREDQGIPEDKLKGGGTGAFWSQNTTDFKAQSEQAAKGDPNIEAGDMEMNYNEIDILATFHDWGFPVEALGTVGGDVPRYQGREKFWAWLHGGGIQ